MSSSTETASRKHSEAEARVVTIKTEAGELVRYSGNPAELPGCRHEVRKALQRVNAFKLLITHNASRLKTGVVCVEDIDNILIVTDMIQDPNVGTYNYENPCPDTPTRVTRMNVSRVAAGEPPYAGVPNIGMLPPHILKLAIPNRDEVETEALAYALTQLSIFEDKVHANELLVQCDYDGRKLGPILDAIEGEALAIDIGLVVGRRNKFKEAGLNGQPLTKDSFKKFFIDFHNVEYKCPPAERLTEDVLTQMISTLFITDPSTRKTWSEHMDQPVIWSTNRFGDQYRASGPPQTFRETKSLAEKLLRSSATIAGIDELSSPSRQVLSAEHVAALASANIKPELLGESEALSVATALLAASGSKPNDPRKNLSTNPGPPSSGSIEVPKGEDGKYLYWAPPMSQCECGAPDEGRHVRYKWPCFWAPDADAASSTGGCGKGQGQGGPPGGGRGKGAKGKKGGKGQGEKGKGKGQANFAEQQQKQPID